MGLLLRAAYFGPATALAADLGRYGSGAQWRGVYYKGEKIGFVVAQTLPADDGYELMEDGRLQMTLLGATTAAQISTRARVDRDFALRSFSFSLDPGTGPIRVDGQVNERLLEYTVRGAGSARRETRELPEPPALSLNLPRQLAARGLRTGARLSIQAFDPATLQNAPMEVVVGPREVVWAAGRPVPAFRVHTRFVGVETSSWVTDVGEVVKEESPLGLIVVRETRDRAMSIAVPGSVQLDLIEAAAVQPKPPKRIDNTMDVELLRLRLTGGDFAAEDLQGAGQSVAGEVFEIRDPEAAPPIPAPAELARYTAPEPFIESDAPEILAEAGRAVQGAADARQRADRLVRHVHALLRKKPTVSLPSALEVLRTRVGDCNEHTALLVALARAAGLPARVAVGLVYMQGAFYYHAWAELFVEVGRGKGRWLPADPTLNQFPADLTHVRLTRGGLDRQAVLTRVMGRLEMTILELKQRAGTTPVLVGRAPLDTRPIDVPLPRRDGSGRSCWSRVP
jgi:transglutaminase-like putative cysteine protease